MYWPSERVGSILLSKTKTKSGSERSSMASKLSLRIDQEMLLRQMQHHVANSLQIAASTLSLKARTANSHDARPHLMNAYSRVDAPKAATVRLDYHKGA